MPQKSLSPDERLERALNSPTPRIYANTFLASMTSGDVLILLESNGSPVAVLNLSLTVAKTLGAALSGTISTIEARMERPIMTSSELEQALKAFVSPATETKK